MPQNSGDDDAAVNRTFGPKYVVERPQPASPSPVTRDVAQSPKLLICQLFNNNQILNILLWTCIVGRLYLRRKSTTHGPILILILPSHLQCMRILLCPISSPIFLKTGPN
ncbi:hypothetical protein ACOSP7_020908 [Xanthoceras sorbifolium]